MQGNANPSVVGSRRKLQCKAKSRRSGERCRRWAVNGATVCVMHGAAKGTPARRKAEEQLRLARDELMEMLLTIARDTTQSANDRLKAITWALERAGFKAGLDIDFQGELETKGYMEVLAGLFKQPAVEAENNNERKAVAPPAAESEADRLRPELGEGPKPQPRQPEPDFIEGEFVPSDDTPPDYIAGPKWNRLNR